MFLIAVRSSSLLRFPSAICSAVNRTLAVNDLRAMLDWPEVKANPLAAARIARSLRGLRESFTEAAG